jgi:uncharacterized protein (TIGR01244 family)
MPALRILGLLALTPAFSALASAESPQTVGPALIPGYVVVRPGLASAGQPSADGLRQLKALGFKTVVNLRTPIEGAPLDEAEIVRGQGLRYVSVPMTAATVTSKDLETIQAVLDDPAAEPVLLHCASGNRTGGIWAAVLARKGKSLEEAETEGRKAGLKSPEMVAAFRRLATDKNTRPEPGPSRQGESQ